MTNREDPFGINQKRTGVFVLFWKKRDRKGENVMLSESIKKLVQYGVETGITPECERIYATNLLLDAFGESEYTEPETEYAKIDLEATLDELLDEAVKRGIIEDSVVYSKKNQEKERKPIAGNGMFAHFLRCFWCQFIFPQEDR